MIDIANTIDINKSAGKSFLRWAGSKKQLLPKLSMFWGNGFNRYIEPFMGSASLFFALQPKSAILGDINSDLINTFIQVRNNPNKIYKILQTFPINKEAYYNIRALDPNTLSKEDRSARFIYLNRMCFNGLYRINQKGVFNVPYASNFKANLPTEELLYICSHLLKRAELIEGDFTITLRNARKGDFVYLDPPFMVQKRKVFNAYSIEPFNSSDLSRLANCLDILNSRGVSFVVSYADCKEGRSVLSKWNLNRYRTRRNIAGFVKYRRFAYELIATNLSLSFNKGKV